MNLLNRTGQSGNESKGSLESVHLLGEHSVTITEHCLPNTCQEPVTLILTSAIVLSFTEEEARDQVIMHSHTIDKSRRQGLSVQHLCLSSLPCLISMFTLATTVCSSGKKKKKRSLPNTSPSLPLKYENPILCCLIEHQMFLLRKVVKF